MPFLGILIAVFPSLCPSSVPGCSGSGSGCAGAGPGEHWGSLQGSLGLLDSEHHSALPIILCLAAPGSHQRPARLSPGAISQLGKRRQCLQHRARRGWSLWSLVFPGWVVGSTRGWAPWALIQVSGTHYLEPHSKALRVVTLCVFASQGRQCSERLRSRLGTQGLPAGAPGFRPCLWTSTACIASTAAHLLCPKALDA